MKRSFQGRLKAIADDLGEQFSPGNTKMNRYIVSDSLTRETSKNGVVRSEIEGSPENTQINEEMVIQDSYREYWGGRP